VRPDSFQGDANPLAKVIAPGKFGRGRSRARSEWIAYRIHGLNIATLPWFSQYR